MKARFASLSKSWSSIQLSCSYPWSLIHFPENLIWKTWEAGILYFGCFFYVLWMPCVLFVCEASQDNARSTYRSTTSTISKHTFTSLTRSGSFTGMHPHGVSSMHVRILKVSHCSTRVPSKKLQNMRTLMTPQTRSCCLKILCWSPFVQLEPEFR